MTRPDPLTAQEWLESLDAMADDDEPPDGDEQEDPPPLDCDWGQIDAGCRQAAEDQARADATAARLGLTGALGAVAALNGRRGPGQPGS